MTPEAWCQTLGITPPTREAVAGQRAQIHLRPTPKTSTPTRARL